LCWLYAPLLLLKEFVQLHHQLVECLGSLLDLDSLAEIRQSLSFFVGHSAASCNVQNRNLGTAFGACLTGCLLKTAGPAFSLDTSLST
jgi:hypothetical protein